MHPATDAALHEGCHSCGVSPPPAREAARGPSSEVQCPLCSRFFGGEVIEEHAFLCLAERERQCAPAAPPTPCAVAAAAAAPDPEACAAAQRREVVRQQEEMLLEMKRRRQQELDDLELARKFAAAQAQAPTSARTPPALSQVEQDRRLALLLASGNSDTAAAVAASPPKEARKTAKQLQEEEDERLARRLAAGEDAQAPRRETVAAAPAPYALSVETERNSSPPLPGSRTGAGAAPKSAASLQRGQMSEEMCGMLDYVQEMHRAQEVMDAATRGQLVAAADPALRSLASMFPDVDLVLLNQVLQEQHGNVESTAALLVGDEAPAPAAAGAAGAEARGTGKVWRLSLMFPSAPRQVLETALAECGDDLERTVAWLLGEPSHAPPPPDDFMEVDEVPYYPSHDAAYAKLPDARVPVPLVKLDFKIPAQSLNGRPRARGLEGQITTAVQSATHKKWAEFCFRTMLKREQEHHGEFFVFYHSYSFASLLYEVQCVLAQAIFNLPDGFAPLPRLLTAPFHDKPILSMLVEEFSRMAGQDHDPRFRALAISTSVSLFGEDTEAPPLSNFENGYSCGDLSFRGLLEGLVTACGARGRQVQSIADAIVAIGTKYGLATSMYGSRAPRAMVYPGATGMSTGNMLQIFVHRDLVDDVAYRAMPMGVPVNTHEKLSGTLLKGPAAGQARVFMHPELFTDSTKARLGIRGLPDI
eukprot:m51a1_g552 hypothetical protein (703) ;mRNA; r:452804-455145